MIGSFDFAEWRFENFVRPVMKQRICQRSADAFVEEDEHERGFDSFVGEAVAVASSDAFEQAMGFILRRS